MKKNFGLLFALATVFGGALLTGGCVVDDDVDAVDDDPDTTVVNPPAPDSPDVTVTPPAGGSVDIDR
jgi:hypothetical protein